MRKSGLKLVKSEKFEQLENEHAQLSAACDELILANKELKAQILQLKQVIYTLQTGSTLTLN